MSKKMTIEELRVLKELINSIDEKNEVFKLSSTIIEEQEKNMIKIKENNESKGEKKV